MRLGSILRRKFRSFISLAALICLCIGAFLLLSGNSSSLLSDSKIQIIFIDKKPDFKEVKLLHKEEGKAVGENPADAIKVENDLEERKKEKEGKELEERRKEKVVLKPDPIAPPKHVNPPDNLDIQNRIYEKQIQEELAAVIPGYGDNGAAVHFTADEEKQVEEIVKKEAFNKLASDHMSLNRTLSDVRSSKCRDITYDHQLPSASVIIIFTNEAWSPLIRTINSVINRSPAHLLKEIVLVDDFSDKEDLKGKLDYYISSRFSEKVRIVRLKERHGLIRARLEGAKAALGDVIIFLDSHCEATEGWIEPLLARIKESRKAVLVPIIDVIDDKTLQYFNSNGDFFQIGGFTWSGHFTWINVPEAEKKRRGSPVAPTRSPTMAGGLFAIDRNFFWESGSYDEGMDVWGGENLEMSFRIWMCGGTLETIPCSRVGHIFRSFHPYSFPGNKDTHGLNTARMAEVWMDDYKRLFYMYRPELQTDPLVGNVDERRQLRKDMKCKNFKWFLDNVIPEKFILDEQSIAYGKVRNVVNGVALCLDNLQRNEDEPYIMGYYQCHEFLASSQFMSLSVKNQLRREEMCATLDTADSSGNSPVRMADCKDNDMSQKWIYSTTNELKHSQSGQCLDRGTRTSMADAYARKCSDADSQKWVFDHSS